MRTENKTKVLIIVTKASEKLPIKISAHIKRVLEIYTNIFVSLYCNRIENNTHTYTDTNLIQ